MTTVDSRTGAGPGPARSIVWIAYAAAWMCAALLLTLTATTATGFPPGQIAPHAVRAMGTAGLLGLIVWYVSGRLHWAPGQPRFVVLHGLALVAYAGVYALSWAVPDLLAGRFSRVGQMIRRTPTLSWDLYMGAGIYLLVAGVSYAVRAEMRARRAAAAAAEAAALEQRARLDALRARLQPHFLFNALHTIAALIQRSPETAERAVESIGDLLRYVLRTEGSVPLAEEWSFTTRYLEVERLRLGHRLRVDDRLDPGAAHVMVPPLLVQPVVENAVRHGIALRAEGGTVRLDAALDCGRLTITVRNDVSPDVAHRGDGIGLTSIRARLQAAYGERASVATAVEGGQFMTTITLPVDRVDEPAV